MRPGPDPAKLQYPQSFKGLFPSARSLDGLGSRIDLIFAAAAKDLVGLSTQERWDIELILLAVVMHRSLLPPMLVQSLRVGALGVFRYRILAHF